MENINSNVECSLKKRTWQLYASISDFDHPVTNRSRLGRKKRILYFHYLLCSCVISASPNLPCWFFRENIHWLFFLYTPLRSGKNYLPYASDCISENGDQQMASKIFFIWCWITNLRGKNKVSKHEYTIRRFMLTGFSDIALHVHFQIVSNLSG